MNELKVFMKNKNSFQNSNVLVLGAGISGRACAKWLIKNDSRVTLVDTRKFEIPISKYKNLTVKTGVDFSETAESVEKFEFIIPSASLSPYKKNKLNISNILRSAKNKGIKIRTEVDLFEIALCSTKYEKKYQNLNSERSKVLAITGTNGKTSVVNMLNHILSKCNLDVQLAGNIGLPLLEAIIKREKLNKFPDVWVLELSSFQLALTKRFNPSAACILNIAEDHLDWHISLKKYLSAKMKIFGVPKSDAIPVICSDDESLKNKIENYLFNKNEKSQKEKVFFGIKENSINNNFGIIKDKYEWICCLNSLSAPKLLLKTSDFKLKGKHNLLNVLSALSLASLICNKKLEMLSSLKNFEYPSHRLEKIWSFKKINFVDDSKATNVSATVAALKSIDDPIYLILGGDLKGQCLKPLCNVIKRRKIFSFVFGKDKEKIKNSFYREHISVEVCADMSEILKKIKFSLERFCLDFTNKDITVLLSPACSSTDMFKNYVHRAEEFSRLIRKLFGNKKYVGK